MESINIPVRIADNLWPKVNAAFKAIGVGDFDYALERLNTFIDAVEAYREKILEDPMADALIDAAQALMDEINPEDPFSYAMIILQGQREEEEKGPETYALFQNYPNPFNPSTNIRFNLPEAANVNLSIYNATGQLVTTLVKQYSESGTYQVKWIANDYPSGIYIARLRANSFTSIKKMMLMK